MITALTDELIDQVLPIWLQGNKEAHPFIAPYYWEKHLPMMREALSEAEVWVYMHHEKVCGFIGLQDHYIAGVFVDRSFRSQGIGHRLLEHAKSLHPHLTLHVYEKNQRAIAFYTRERFLPIRQGIDAAVGLTEIEMQWQCL